MSTNSLKFGEPLPLPLLLDRKGNRLLPGRTFARHYFCPELAAGYLWRVLPMPCGALPAEGPGAELRLQCLTAPEFIVKLSKNDESSKCLEIIYLSERLFSAERLMATYLEFERAGIWLYAYYPDLPDVGVDTNLIYVTGYCPFLEFMDGVHCRYTITINRRDFEAVLLVQPAQELQVLRDLLAAMQAGGARPV